MRDPLLLIRHILDSILRIEQYTLSITQEEFLGNFLIQDAVIRNLEIIGEASRSVPAEIKDVTSDIPWRKISGMRNKLVHEYFSVDMEPCGSWSQWSCPR
jgi:uncharacterized protein with HEPN domain